MATNTIAPLSKNQLHHFAKQLACPTGKKGIVMGDALDDANKQMILESIQLLDIQPKNRVLELGHGNCSYLPEILKQAKDVKYFGMEISEAMQQKAAHINAAYIKKRVALFKVYDGQKVPYVLGFFDRILTVNTLYFWPNPVSFLKETYRLLKPNGIFIVTFAKSSFMKTLPFVAANDVFNLYSNTTFKELVAKTHFEILEIKNKKENVKNTSGEWVERSYSIAILRKNKIALSKLTS